MTSHQKFRLFAVLTLTFLCGFLALLTGCQPSNEKKIGIILPIEHKAMEEIVAGFSETIRAQYKHPLKIKVANAQGDINLERAIIQQMRDEHYDIIVPVGTDATQMSAAIIKKQNIVSLAATLSQTEREKMQPCNLAIVHDEISASQLMQFIHQVNPGLTKLVLLHSAADKVFPEVEAAKQAAQAMGIEIKPMMVQTLNDLSSTANHIPADAEGIVLLKDHLMVSGVATIEKAAEKRHIPLITSDQGSVQDGAGYALGVHERQIGVDGAKLALAILSGKPPCDLPVIEMTKLTVFINKNSLDQEQQALSAIENAAKKLNYNVETL